MRRHLPAALLPALLALACTAPIPAHSPGGHPAGAGGGDPGSGGPPAIATPTLPGDGCLDFGTVMLGLERTLPMEVSSLAAAGLSIDVKVLENAFTVEPAHLDLGPHGKGTIDVRFFPPARGAYLADLLFQSCEDCAPVKRCLKGTAAVESFAIEPSPVAFGTHGPDTTTCQDVSIENTGDVPIYARDIRLDDGLTRVAGSFELQLGDILNNKEIEPGESASFQLCFTPRELGQKYAGSVLVYTDNQQQKVAVTGRGGGARIVAVPDHIDYGITILGRAETRRVMLTNVGEPTDVDVISVQWTPDDGSLALEYPALPFNIGADGDFPIDVTFTGTVPGDYAGAIEVTLHSVDANTDDVITIPVTAQVIAGDPCDLLLPDRVDFGFVREGVARREVRIRNAGATECYVWDFALDETGSPHYALEGAPGGLHAIPPGQDLTLTVVFTHTGPRIEPESSNLLFKKMTSATEDPQVTIPLDAFGSGQCLRVDPSPVDFGTIPLGHVAARSFNLTNCGASPIAIGDIVVTAWSDPGIPGPDPGFSLRGVPSLPFTLPAGQRLDLVLVHEPKDVGEARAQLQIWPRNAAEPIVVEVYGEAVDEPCGELCEAPQAVCPAAQSAWVNAAVPLAGFALDAIDGENPPDNPDLTCAWTVAGAPPASVNFPAEPTSCRTTFRPDWEGDYTLKLTVTDHDGHAASCETKVHADIFEGLWIETTWSAPDDVDLHLFHPDAGDILDPGTWFDLPYDCSASNPHPRWDAPSLADDPRMDRTDAAGTGPEIVRIDRPSTEHSYEIGVHWFGSRNGNRQQDVTTKVYCGGELAPTLVRTLQPYNASWVASVEWQAGGGCEVTERSGALTLIP